MTIRRALAVAALWLLFGGPAQAQDDWLKDARNLPVYVHTVQSGGFWQVGEQDGFYRIVVMAGGFEHVLARLYVQWITTDQDSREYKVVRTVNVTEFNGGGASGIEPRLQFKPGTKNLVVALTVNRRDGKAEKRTLTLTPEGRYILR